MATTDTEAYKQFSIKELLEIRDRYHMHLIHTDQDNVIGTALGRFLFRKDRTQKRTIDNLDVETSAAEGFPCLLVIVKRWKTDEVAGAQAIPKFLYLEDGRKLRTCVISAERTAVAPEPPVPELRNAELLGGGYPAIVDVQGEQHRGTLTCLVTDGDKTYAMASGHVTGEPGRVIHTEIAGRPVRIGVTAKPRVGKLPLAKAFPGWTSEQLQVNLDIGLVELDNVKRWTADVFGLGELGPMIDLEPHTMSLDLIGKELFGHGAASGAMTGRIIGFFYRYESMGGSEYVADLLIGGVPGKSLISRHGDSGTLFVLREAPDELPRPVAVQWGGDRLTAPGAHDANQLVLASCLSTACRVLELELVRRRRSGQFEYWGKYSHPLPPSLAIDRIGSDKLRRLLERNRDNIAFLAPKPDDLKMMGRPAEAAAHHWNMDMDGGGEFAGSRLIDLCARRENIKPSVWLRFYEQAKQVDPSKPTTEETLPFRLGAIYDEMVKAVKARKLADFVVAAAFISHYAADAVTPMHLSKYHDGFADRPIVKSAAKSSAPRPRRKPSTTWPGKGIHSAVDALLDPDTASREDVERTVRETFDDSVVDPDITSGQDAVFCAVGLMRWAFDKIEPGKLIDAYVAAGNRVPWDAFGAPICECVAKGVLFIADLWESAWRQGGGEDIPLAELRQFDLKRDLEPLYRTPKFLPSLSLEKFVPIFG